MSSTATTASRSRRRPRLLVLASGRPRRRRRGTTAPIAGAGRWKRRRAAVRSKAISVPQASASTTRRGRRITDARRSAKSRASDGSATRPRRRRRDGAGPRGGRSNRIGFGRARRSREFVRWVCRIGTVLLRDAIGSSGLKQTRNVLRQNKHFRHSLLSEPPNSEREMPPPVPSSSHLSYISPSTTPA